MIAVSNLKHLATLFNKSPSSMKTIQTPSQAKFLGFTASAALIALTAVAISSTAHADTKTWNGSNTGNPAWYANTNWTPGTAPVDGDDLVFAGTTLLTHNSYANTDGDNILELSGITFDNTAGAFTINNGGGGTIKLQGDITNNSTNLQRLNFPFELNANVTVNAAAGDIRIGGTITQDGTPRNIRKLGSNRLVLTGSNTMSGSLLMGSNVAGATGGTVVVTNSSALGTKFINWENDGTLELAANNLTLANSMGVYFRADSTDIWRTLKLDLDGTNTGELQGSIDIRRNVFRADVGANDTLTLSGNAYSGAAGGNITKVGAGTLRLTGSNSHNGGVTIEEGTVSIRGNNSYVGSNTVNGGTLAFAGSGTISESSAIVINDTATLRFDRNDTWGNANTDTSSSITVNAGGTMESGGFFTTIRDLKLNGGTVAMTGGVNATYPALALKGTVTVGGSQASQINIISGTNNMISIGDGNLGATVFNVADATGDASADLSVNAVLQNNGPVGGNSLTKTGSGTMELTATNTYTGSTTVSAGTLSLASGYAHNGSGTYTVNGGTLKIADGVNLGSHAMTISLGGVISPGNSPGTAIVGTQNWGDGGSYLWEINNSGGFKGSDPGWDWLSITGDLNLGTLSASQFTIDITSLDLSNNSGLATGFDYSGLAYGDLFDSFTIATTSGDINDFNSNLFSLNDSAFVNSKWDWQIRQNGKDLVLDAIFVPEPSSTALLGIGGLALLLRRKRS